MVKQLEVNQSNEWLIVFSGISFVGIPECEQDEAATYFTNTLHDALVDDGFRVTQARGERRTCNGWNGAEFTRRLGPVGCFDELTDDEEGRIQQAINNSVADMRDMWISETVTLCNYVAMIEEGIVNCQVDDGTWRPIDIDESIYELPIMDADGVVDEGGWVWDKKGDFSFEGQRIIAMEAYSNKLTIG